MTSLGPFLLSRPHRRSKPKRRASVPLPRWLPAAIAGLLIAAAGIFAILIGFRSGPPLPSSELPITYPSSMERQSFLSFRPPTAQTNLCDTTSTGVYMPTISGKVESALYDSSRMRVTGGRTLPAFHEGIDIAALQRNRRGLAMDPVSAAAPGVVAYINRHAGNSSYGIYVVLRHKDPVGEIYTLYAHLSSVQAGLSVGKSVSAGDLLGVMGNTPASNITVSRSHLHFEVGTMINARFSEWFRALKVKPDHGLYQGWNLSGINPLAVFCGGAPDGRFSMNEYLLTAPAAFTLIVRNARGLDYFKRYPTLWQSGMSLDSTEAVALMVSVGGVLLRGRPATAGESDRLARNSVLVLEVQEAVLGRNGRRLISRPSAAGEWALTASGEQWLEILQYPFPRASRSGPPLLGDE